MRAGGTIAFVRAPTEALTRCELTHIERIPIDIDLAREQHAAYVATLEALGARIEWLPPLPDHPDAVFVEDTALLVADLAVITRPGAPIRRGEVESVARALQDYRPVRRIEPPATLDGGDVVTIGHTVFVGLSSRTNAEAVRALKQILAERDYTVVAVPLRKCLHLKSACTFIPPDILVANGEWVDTNVFQRLRIIAADPHELGAANTLTLGGCTLVPSTAARTEKKLRQAGLQTKALEVSELQKAEAALTCMSLVVPA